MGWNMKLLVGSILRGKSERELQDEERDGDEGDPRAQLHCEIKGLHRRRITWCSDAYNCADCWYFKKYAPAVKWMCCRCLSQLEEMVGFKAPVLDHYHSGFCELCKEETILLLPVVTGGGNDTV